MAIRLTSEDITSLTCEVIVNSAHPGLLGIGPDLPAGVGGVDGAIHRAAGKALYDHCLSLPIIGYIRGDVPMRCRPGDCVVTPGFGTKAALIIHTVAPVFRDYPPNESFRMLESCYRQIAMKSEELKPKSLAIPPLGTRAFGIPKDAAAKLACKTLQDMGRLDMLLVISVIDQEEYSLYKKYLGQSLEVGASPKPIA